MAAHAKLVVTLVVSVVSHASHSLRMNATGSHLAAVAVSHQVLSIMMLLHVLLVRVRWGVVHVADTTVI